MSSIFFIWDFHCRVQLFVRNKCTVFTVALRSVNKIFSGELQFRLEIWRECLFRQSHVRGSYGNHSWARDKHFFFGKVPRRRSPFIYLSCKMMYKPYTWIKYENSRPFKQQFASDFKAVSPGVWTISTRVSHVVRRVYMVTDAFADHFLALGAFALGGFAPI